MKRPAFLAALAASVLRPLPASANRNGRWGTAAALPLPRQAFAIAVTGSEIFIMGGYSDGGQQLNAMYDTAYDRWTERAPLPVPLNYPAAAAVNGMVYVFGGFAQTPAAVPGRAQGGSYRYDPRADTWTAVATMPTSRAGFALVERHGSLYAIGGRAKLDYNANERYDPADDSWDTLAPLPLARDQLAGVMLQEEIHVTGGRQFQLGENSARHDIYNVGEDSWRPGPPLPATRSGHAAVLLGHRMLLVGGESNTGLNDDLIAFDADRAAWESLATMPHPRHGFGAAAVNGTLYAIGGSTGYGLSGASALNETFSL